MNIGMFSDTYAPQINGVATSIKIYKEKLTERGHKVVVVAPSAPRDEKDVLVVKSIPFPSERQHRISIAPTKRILDFVRENKVQILHSHSPFFMGFKALKIQEEMMLPHVHTYHTLLPEYRHYIPKPFTPPRKMVEHFSAWFCNLVNVVIAPTEDIKSELESYGVKRPIKVLPTGIEIEKFENAKADDLRKKYGLVNKKVILYVGRIAKEKNIEFLLHVFEKVNSPDTVFVMVGDGPERKEVEEFARKRQLNVVVTGYIPHEKIPKYYKIGDVFLFASKTETQGLVLLEALASGLPVVALKWKGVKDVLKGCEGAILIEKENTEDFARILRNVLENHRLREELSEKGKDFVRKNWSVEFFVSKLEEIYLEALEEGPLEINTSLMIKEFVKFEKLKEFFSKLEDRIWR
ncbi:glycosyltransferase family 4 protein [Thermotoga sp. KOL6]|uniref:glycosyltransferase family 4 protein n=1 Tax=Thermotoga sp. KOL6 TaxID=126741 RepID=UPI000C75F123|nr:glycosyltransferase family 4 protein [Thermotoga sp. KOL6]PLV59444.1 glycosyl transferase family 1 [Thermotoga sp. KOL6]